MAKRVDKSRFELEELGYRTKREDEFIERLVLPSDTLQGIALIYNTTIAELKKINHLLSDTELHARRVIKVPSKGILIDLTDDSARPPQAGASVDFISEEFPVSDDEADQDNNGQVYLSNVDSIIEEIKQKAEAAASNSPILNGSDSPLLSRKGTVNKINHYDLTKKNSDIKWWMLLLPCLVMLIGFPFLYFLYRKQQEHLDEELHEILKQHNLTRSSS